MNSTATRTGAEYNAHSEVPRLRAELSAMKREKERVEKELERRREETPSLTDFPPGMVAAAHEYLKRNLAPGDYMANVFYLCERWTYMPYVPDAPPINGIMTPCPMETIRPVPRAYAAHPMPELQDDTATQKPSRELTSIGAIIERLNIKGK